MTYTLEQFRCGNSNEFMDGNGDYITEEEAQAEVDWLNNRYFPKEAE